MRRFLLILSENKLLLSNNFAHFGQILIRISHEMNFFPQSFICRELIWRDEFLQIFDLWSDELWITRRGLTLLDEVSEGQDREIEWPRGALVSTKWRTSYRLSKIYGSYNALLSQWSNQARILIQIVIYKCVNI